MKITAVITKVFTERTDLLKAASNVTLEDTDGESFVIKNIRVIEGAHGLFMSLPSHRNVKGEYREICYPISPMLRRRMNEAVLTANEKAIQKAGAPDAPPPAG